MKKYWICRWITGIHIWKLNKKWTEFLDKETLTKEQVLCLISDCANYVLWEGNKNALDVLDIKHNWELEFRIIRCKKS